MLHQTSRGIQILQTSPLSSSDHNTVQLIPGTDQENQSHQADHRWSVDCYIYNSCKCKGVIDTTDWELLLSENIDNSEEAVTAYVNFTLSSIDTCRDFYVNTKHLIWVTPETKQFALRSLFRCMDRAHLINLCNLSMNFQHKVLLTHIKHIWQQDQL